MFRKWMLLVLCMFVAIGAVADEDDWMKKARNSKAPAGIESPDASVREAKVGGSKMTGDPLGAPAVVNVYDLFKIGER